MTFQHVYTHLSTNTLFSIVLHKTTNTQFSSTVSTPYENQNFVTLSDAAIENFTKYLTTKCPNLEKPIQIEKAEDVFSFIVFGSCIISESESSISYESSSISSLTESDFSISSEESERD